MEASNAADNFIRNHAGVSDQVRLEDREEVDDVRNGIMVAFPLPHCHILLSVLVSSDSYPVSFPDGQGCHRYPTGIMAS
jgi:hypothetical protein